ncbi:MAG: sigma-70 family RNA polymerase sigma factor [Myxococcota bacterium]
MKGATLVMRGGPHLVQAPRAPVEADATELVHAALRKDVDAVALLVRRLMPVVQSRARRFMARLSSPRRSRFDLDDLVQDVWCDMLKDGGRALRRFDPGRNPSLEYFVVLLADRRLSHVYEREFKTQKRRVDLESKSVEDLDRYAAPGDTPASKFEEAELQARLSRYLDERLPAKGRLICRMLYSDGASPEQIVAALGVSKQVVYNWQHRIRSLAQEFLAGSA